MHNFTRNIQVIRITKFHFFECFAQTFRHFVHTHDHIRVFLRQTENELRDAQNVGGFLSRLFQLFVEDLEEFH